MMNNVLTRTTPASERRGAARSPAPPWDERVAHVEQLVDRTMAADVGRRHRMDDPRSVFTDFRTQVPTQVPAAGMASQQVPTRCPPGTRPVVTMTGDTLCMTANVPDLPDDPRRDQLPLTGRDLCVPTPMSVPPVQQWCSEDCLEQAGWAGWLQWPGLVDFVDDICPRPRFCPLPCIPPTQAERDAATQHYDLVDDDPGTPLLTDDKRDLVAAGWSSLLKNIDLVRWAACWVKTLTPTETLDNGNVVDQIRPHRSRVRFAECVTRVLEDTDPVTRQEVRWVGGIGQNSWGQVIDDVVLLSDIRFAGRPPRGDGISAAKHLESWNSGVPGSQLCAALWMATILVHEIGHVCGTGSDADAFQNPCRASHMFSTSLLSAMLQRYPCIRESDELCAWTTDHDPWMFGGPIQPATGRGYEDLCFVQ